MPLLSSTPIVFPEKSYSSRKEAIGIDMLLGMEKDKLSLVFLLELSVIGLVCFLLCAALGTGIFSACCVEILSIFFMKRKIYKLQIVELIREKQRKQPLDADNKIFWS